MFFAKSAIGLISHSTVVAYSLLANLWSGVHALILHRMICLYRRTTGPIRRAKGGWTAEEVSLFIGDICYFSPSRKVDWTGNFVHLI